MVKRKPFDIDGVINRIDKKIKKTLKEEILKEFESARNFYFRYLNQPSLFCKEQFDITYTFDGGSPYVVDRSGVHIEYNAWLFDIAFASLLLKLKRLKKNEVK